MKLWLIGFEAEGLNLDRLTRMAGDQGLTLMRVSRKSQRCLHGYVQENEYPQLQQLCERGGWRLTRGNRTGAGKIAEILSKRWLTPLIVLLLGSLVMIASMRIWRVEIVDAGSYLGDVQTFLHEQYISPGLKKSDIDLEALREQLEWRYPKVAWIECGLRGMTLVIGFHEGLLPSAAISNNGKIDVVASRSGVIERIITVAGTPVVKAGDVVQAGDVLIRGEERIGDEQVRPVAARGTVMAYVWDGTRIRMPVYEANTRYTGRSKTVNRLTMPWFDLNHVEPSEYEQSDIRRSIKAFGGLFIPVVLVTETSLEAQIQLEKRDLTQLKAEVAACAKQKLCQNFNADDILVDIWVNFSMIDDEEVEAFAVGKRCIEIGARQQAKLQAVSE